MCDRVLVGILMMDVFSLEDDDMGLFITQTPSNNVQNISDLLDVSMEDFENNEVGTMHYSDISDDNGLKEANIMQSPLINFK